MMDSCIPNDRSIRRKLETRRNMNDDFLAAQAEYHQALAEHTASTNKMRKAKARMMELDRRKRPMFVKAEE